MPRTEERRAEDSTKWMTIASSSSWRPHRGIPCTTLQQLTNKFALSHIYTHMTFELFTHIAPGGSLEHIHICLPSSRLERLPPGLQSSGSSYFPSGGTCFPTKTSITNNTSQTRKGRSTKGGSHQAGPTWQNSYVECGYCFKFGHYEAECRKKKSESAFTSR